MTLPEFLLARIDEDEARVREWQGLLDDGTVKFDDGMGALAWVGANRVLTECEAKRRIVEHHAGDQDPWAFSPEPLLDDRWCRTLQLLAEPYADHPDYRQEWRP